MEYTYIHNHQSQFLEWFGGDKFVSTTLPEISENMDYKRVPITSGDRNVGQFPYYGASGIVDYIDNYIFDEPLLLVSEDGANLKDRVTPIAFIAEGKYWVNNHAHVLKFTNFANMTYICHFFNFTNIEKYLTGMAQPKLNQAQLNTIKIPWPPVKMQEQFAALVEQADKSKFDGFKSQFIEWFGDMKYLTSDKTMSDFFDMKAGQSITAENIIATYDLELFPCYGGNGLRGYVTHYTHEGHYCLIGRQGALCGNVNLTDGKFFATEHAIVVTPKISINTYWLFFALSEMNLNRFARGVAQPGLSVKQLETIPFSIPPTEEQDSFERLYRQADKSKYYEINETSYGIL